MREAVSALAKIAAACVVVLAVPAVAWAVTLRDPIPYCQSVGTIDKPDHRYAGPEVPAWMRRAVSASEAEGTFVAWRCSAGVVLACTAPAVKARYLAYDPRCMGPVPESRKPFFSIDERGFAREHWTPVSRQTR